MTQKTDGTDRVFKQIKLNINLCTNELYLKNFDTYIRQILIHELGHYLYYFKDATTEKFDAICRKKGVLSCASTDFVSAYAMKNKEEDYAESFAHWYLSNTNGGEMIVDTEHKSADTSKLQQTKDAYFRITFGVLG